VREAALERLLGMRWVRAHRVTVSGQEEAVASEDAFDALLTAAGLLRCVLEGTAMTHAALEDTVAEGGILGLGGLDLSRPEGRLAQRTSR
jgi:hypothetical protein